MNSSLVLLESFPLNWMTHMQTIQRHEKWGVPSLSLCHLPQIIRSADQTRAPDEQIVMALVPFFMFPPFFHHFKYVVRTFHTVRGEGRLFPQLMKGSCLPLTAFEAQPSPRNPARSRPRNLLVIYDYLDKW